MLFKKNWKPVTTYILVVMHCIFLNLVHYFHYISVRCLSLFTCFVSLIMNFLLPTFWSHVWDTLTLNVRMWPFLIGKGVPSIYHTRLLNIIYNRSSLLLHLFSTNINTEKFISLRSFKNQINESLFNWCRCSSGCCIKITHKFHYFIFNSFPKWIQISEFYDCVNCILLNSAISEWHWFAYLNYNLNL